MKTLFSIIIIMAAALLTASCIEDGYATSADAQPKFSTDTLKMGLSFTEQPTPTSRFTVHNRNNKILSISRIALRSGAESAFRINVDGSAGESFSDIEIRPNDSIYIFVEATLPATGSGEARAFTDHIDFLTNGVSSSVVVRADGCDVKRVKGYTVSSDEVWKPGMMYQVFDSLVVAPGATLTLDPGVTLCFHAGAYMKVDGTLIAEGTAEAPVEMRGDRTDNVLTDISFDLMASQWTGLAFGPESRGNRLRHANIRNTEYGIRAYEDAEVEFINCRLRNSASYVLTGSHAKLRIIGTEVAEAASGLLALIGGEAYVSQSTFANYYLFAAIRGAAIQLTHFSPDTADPESDRPYLKADFSNSIVYGLGSDLNAGDFEGTDIYFRNCVLKSTGEDDDHFISILWDTDPLYGSVREDYLFDYRLKPESAARTWADPALIPAEAVTDPYGEKRTTVAGAYEQPLPL